MRDILNLDFKNQLNEVSAHELQAQLGKLKFLVGGATGNYSFGDKFSVRGTDSQIAALIAALAGEKTYNKSQLASRKYGLDRASTYRDKARLDRAIRNFERETGMPWPVR